MIITQRPGMSAPVLIMYDKVSKQHLHGKALDTTLGWPSRIMEGNLMVRWVNKGRPVYHLVTVASADKRSANRVLSTRGPSYFRYRECAAKH